MSRISPISEEQRAEIKAAFDLFDTDGNGSISVSELGSLMKKMGKEATETELKDLIHDIDVDGDGEIQFEEFILLFSRSSKSNSADDDLKQAFAVFDADGNGKISKSELRRVMEMLGERLSEAQIDEMMREADENKDGEIDFQEFKRMMAGKM
jgi:calmodulin